MPRSIHMMQKAPINPFEAIKRAYIRRGYIPRYFRKASELKPEKDVSQSMESVIEESVTKKVEEELKKSPTPDENKIEEKAKQLVEEMSSSTNSSAIEELAKKKVEDEAKKSPEEKFAAQAKSEIAKRQAKDATEHAKLEAKTQQEESSQDYDMTENESKLNEKQQKKVATEEVEQRSKIELDLEEEEKQKLSESEETSNEESEMDKSEDKSSKDNPMEQKIKRESKNPMLSLFAEELKASKKNKVKKNENKIQEIKSSTEDILYECETFSLFPDTLKLDREKLTMAKREFFRTATISSVPVSEIMSIEANVGPIFGSVHLIFRFFNDNEKTFSFLFRKDAINLQRLVHGFIIAHHKGVELSKVPTKELRDTLVQIGQGVKD